MNATRFALPPLPQPTYSFRDIPKGTYTTLQGSTVEYVTDRHGFQRCMGEMLLVCKEAVRRHRQRSGQSHKECDGSKPLSLEYLADRLDVDEPLWGYLVRHEGRLQGFVCVTTFTNYEKSFCWDSCHEAAFSSDDSEAAQLRQHRCVDTTGALARQLQSTVRCGNVWEEGIVWPRLAEISLLGGLGCGKLLVNLVLEDLERLQASENVNYDFAVLQATSNSVSFYESLGFVRVGAITERNDKGRGGEENAEEEEKEEDTGEQSEKGKPGILALPENIVMSKVKPYEVKKGVESLTGVAKKFRVDEHDILFLNRMNYPDLAVGSRLLKGTVLRIPDQTSELSSASRATVSADDIQFHICKENDTPRTIAKRYKLKWEDVVRANRSRLTGLQSGSRLRKGTPVRVSHLDEPGASYVPYAHWAFPDDDHFEEGEPSYMMARRLQRKQGAAAKVRPIREALEAPIGTYQPPPTGRTLHVPSVLRKKKQSNNAARQEQPVSGFELFEADLRKKKPYIFERITCEVAAAKVVKEAWNAANVEQKVAYVKQAAQLRLEDKHATHITAKSSEETEEGRVGRSRVTASQVDSTENLFNMVVKVKPGVTETVDVNTHEFTYWYVLTFIPDLRWCHLAPMIQDGTFTKGKAQGRIKWRLVGEDEGKELDISSSLCRPVASKSMKRTTDADKEEWDILDDEDRGESDVASISIKKRQEEETVVQSSSSASEDSQQPQQPKTSNLGPAANEDELVAAIPGGDTDVRVKLKGSAVDKLMTLGDAAKSRKRKHSSDKAPGDGGGALMIATLPIAGDVRIRVVGECLGAKPRRTKASDRRKSQDSQQPSKLDPENDVSATAKQVSQQQKRVMESSAVLARLEPNKGGAALSPSDNPPHAASVAEVTPLFF